MTTLREKLIKIGAKVVGHARYLVPDGRGCYTAQRLRRHLAHDRGTSAASNHVNGVVSSVVTRLNETTGKVCLYDGKFRISPALQPERASGQRSKAARRRHWLVKIRQLGQIWARTGFHLENVG
jgi:hypothetical protein